MFLVVTAYIVITLAHPFFLARLIGRKEILISLIGYIESLISCPLVNMEPCALAQMGSQEVIPEIRQMLQSMLCVRVCTKWESCKRAAE